MIRALLCHLVLLSFYVAPAALAQEIRIGVQAAGADPLTRW